GAVVPRAGRAGDRGDRQCAGVADVDGRVCSAEQIEIIEGKVVDLYVDVVGRSDAADGLQQQLVHGEIRLLAGGPVEDRTGVAGAAKGCLQGQGGHLRRIEGDALRDGDVLRWIDVQLVRGNGVELGLAEVEARRGRAEVGIHRSRGDAERDLA